MIAFNDPSGRTAILPSRWLASRVPRDLSWRPAWLARSLPPTSLATGQIPYPMHGDAFLRSREAYIVVDGLYDAVADMKGFR